MQPLRPVAIAIMLYGIAHLTGANPYLAAFAGGFMTARLSPKAQEAFEQLGEMLAELAKFAALLVFGALLRPQLFVSIGFGGWMVAILTLVLVRPASLAASLGGRRPDSSGVVRRGLVRPEGVRLGGVRAAGAALGHTQRGRGL